MSSRKHPLISVYLDVSSGDPHLLDRLDTLIGWGWLTDDQAKVLALQYLSEALPEPSEVETPPQTAASPPPPPPPPRRSPELLRSLKAEFSVRWLLFLGMFMVAISSVVLAASQWERFDRTAQYLVLFTYTSVFWGVSQWTKRRDNLQLTARTLEIIGVLLVPVNFWAIDGFGLWNHWGGWLTIAIATPVLVTIIARYPPWQDRRSYKFGTGAVYLASAIAHWGWTFVNWPVSAIYLSIALTGVTIAIPRRIAIADSLFLLYATIVLLGRGIVLVPLLPETLGLAVGAIGWIVLTLHEKHKNLQNPSKIKRPAIVALGLLLLVSGWLLSIETLTWQSLGVSLLALWWLGDRLRHNFNVGETIALFFIGLQAYWLTRDLIPPVVRSGAFSTGTQLTASQSHPWVLLSLTLLPYLFLVLWVGDRFYAHAPGDSPVETLRERQRDARKCAITLDLLTAIFALLLGLLGSANPATRSLYLLASSATLAVLTVRRASLPLNPIQPRLLLYLTHCGVLLSASSLLDWAIPGLSARTWGSVLTATAIAEWGLSATFNHLGTEDRPRFCWRTTLAESGLYFGLGLASLSYLGFQNIYLLDDSSLGNGGLVWFAIPIALSAIADRLPLDPRLGRTLATIATIAAVTLTTPTDATRLMGFGLATILSVVNTRSLKQVPTAAIAVGFGLFFAAQFLAIGVWGIPPISGHNWWLVVSGAIATFTLVEPPLRRRGTPLSHIYARSVGGWAIALGVVELLFLSIHTVGIFSDYSTLSVAILLANGILLAAIAVRLARQPSDWAILAFGWALESTVAQTVGYFDRSVLSLGVANIALGLATQWISQWWYRATERPLPQLWQAIPLAYGILGVLLRSGTVTAWTGWTTFGLAAIALGVGRRSPAAKPVLYAGIAGISAAAFELTWYQVAPFTLGDRLVLVATLASAIAYVYQIVKRPFSRYFGLPVAEVEAIAHLHWAIGSIVLVDSISRPIAQTSWVALGTGALLSRYAIRLGRRFPNPRERDLQGEIAAEAWVYAGIAEASAVIVYLIVRLPAVWQQTAIVWGGAIASCIAYFLYFLPWERWGWPARPWRYTALLWPAIAAIWSSQFCEVTAYPWYISAAIVASFYGFLSRRDRNLRIGYTAIALLNWAIWRGLGALQLSDPLWFVLPPSASLLYLAAVDPWLTSRRQPRHFVRIFATGLVCIVLFFQGNWILTGSIGLGFIFAGLMFRVRAFLYLGTGTFLLNAIERLIFLNTLSFFMRSLVGLTVGIFLIWIAATFETRREQIVTFVQNWLIELKQWE
ncbi:hypothetical protein [Oxynema aestuarii]|uniref:DUF2157 domain-containing protein n=1 Tax=Oxynema aestuarii AP17 TaxID=2064643 RepID=A0A6H1TTR3_9CYAN|nr:hypothetical protein [Oxynema aestuarii]QIZ69994.1 hypothetical protein HCG48_04885 [Oxynema aestuarii AP17]